MARAKRTDRADARRRYRQTVAGDPEAGGLEDDASGAPVATTSTPAPSRRTPAASSTAGKPMGFTDAMRVAWHQPDIRADIAALPSLVRTRWFLIPLGAVVLSTAAVAVAPGAITASIFQVLIYPPAMAPVFVVGFFARRASYLLGLIIGIVDALAFVVYVYLIAPHIFSTPVDPEAQQQALISALTIGPMSGLFFAAGAAWYRRFLALSSRQRASARGGQRSGQQRPKASRPARG